MIVGQNGLKTLEYNKKNELKLEFEEAHKRLKKAK